MPLRRDKARGQDAPGFSDKGVELGAMERAPSCPTGRQVKRLKLGPGGRVVIPADFRSAMAIKEGDPVTAILEDGELRLVGLDAAVRRAQATVRKYVPEGVSLIDELVADRIRDAEDEGRDG